VSNTLGGVGAETKFGWRVRTESEAEVVAEATAATVGLATEVVGVAEATVSKVESAPIRETNR